MSGRSGWLTSKYAETAILLTALIASIYLLVELKPVSAQTSKTQSSAITVRYTDLRQAAGITFQQDSTQTEEKYYLETMGTGVAWIDYDQDGLMDLFFVQSAATDIYKPPHPLRCALYRNNGDGTFTEVTEKAGLGGEGHYGQGVAVGDFLHRHELRRRVEAEAAIADRNGDAHQLQLGETGDEVLGISGRSVTLGRTRDELLEREPPQRLAQSLLLLIELVRH